MAACVQRHPTSLAIATFSTIVRLPRDEIERFKQAWIRPMLLRELRYGLQPAHELVIGSQ
jgi:hypothetical protein